MPTLVDILLTPLLVAWGTQAVLSALQARKLRNRLQRHERKAYAEYRPPAAVIVPFKGAEPRLEDALDRLFTQDYPDYRLLLVVESEADPAYGPLQQAMARHPGRRAELIIAGEAGPRQGQKLHNQLAAIARLSGGERDDASVVGGVGAGDGDAPLPGAGELPGGVWVFADSDAVPGPTWLADMVGPLSQERTGVTTGYRWLVPEGEPRGTCWSRLASVMNASVACLMNGRERLFTAWGGSMAMRADFARQHDLVGRLTGAITDDYPVTRMCREADRRVYFVSDALVATPVDFDRRAFLNFVYRQYLITRVYAPRLFLGALVVTWLYVLGFAATWVRLGQAASQLAAGDAALMTWLRLAFCMLLLSVVIVSDQLRASYRAAAVREAFDRSTVGQLQRTIRLDRWATPLWMTLHALLVLRAAFGRTMRWRGIRYRLRGPQDVQKNP